MASQYLTRIQTACPDLAIRTSKVIEDGFVNNIVIVNNERVFRFPKNADWAQDLFHKELRVLQFLHDRLSIGLPQYDHVETHFGSYPLIPGSPLYREKILAQPDHIQDALAAQLATCLSELHAIPIADVKAYEIGSSNVNRDYEVWVKLFEDVQKELFPSMMPHARDWVEQHFAPLFSNTHFMDYEPALINGDIPPYHILWDNQLTRVTGIIDWGTAGLGDPASDLACLLYNYGETFVKRMLPNYPILQTCLDRARFWAGTLELQWALSGVRQKNAFWHTIHIGSAKDIQPIGNVF